MDSVLHGARVHERRLPSPDGDEEQLGALQRRLARRLGEGDVLADEQRHPPEVGVEHGHGVARSQAGGSVLERELYLVVLADEAAVPVEEHGRVVEGVTDPLDHSEGDVHVLSTGDRGDEVSARPRNGFRIRVERSRRTDHVQLLAEHDDVGMLRDRHLLRVAGGLLERIRTVPGAGGTIADRGDANATRRGRRDGREAQIVEDDLPRR